MNIRQMNESEYRIYLKNKFHFSDSALDGKMECFTLCDFMRLCEVNAELLDMVKTSGCAINDTCHGLNEVAEQEN